MLVHNKLLSVAPTEEKDETCPICLNILHKVNKYQTSWKHSFHLHSLKHHGMY